ncbi:hypothetical protein CVT24_010213 [Panaeolus cyanescens]|uniref:Phytanoyl-CoA dioxygenase n=1 Tax=Panaeolus cyanescens TaxID=181874 RepID=A0A409YPU6_9AGAR|nr:hypothetical protein CVT24_010213 [Panaeolus cyanescens]
MTGQDSIREHYDRYGYVVVPDLIPPGESDALIDACERIIDRTRAGNWPHRRVVGKQFPPYGNDHPDSWGVQHVMHPDLKEPVFARWYTSPGLLSTVTDLLGCSNEELQMELFNLLINPVSHDFSLRWHRDDIQEDVDEADERAALNEWRYGVQWNTALYQDSCLWIVPESHKIPRSPGQREVSRSWTPDRHPSEMPGAVQVTIQPGETVFYNSNILHCATYSSKEKRATLHACIGDIKGGSSRARNILQHGLKWMTSPEFRQTLPDEAAKAMLSRLIEMYNASNAGANVVYSLKN